MNRAPTTRADRPRLELPPGEVARDDFRNILIVRLSSVGDIVFALPALEVLRTFYPESRVSWVVEDRASSLIEGHPHLDEVIVMPRRRWRKMRSEPGGTWRMVADMKRFFGDLRRRRFDVAIDFQGNLKSGAVSFLSGASLRLGLARSECREPNWLFSTKRLKTPDGVMHRCERDLRLLTLLDLPYVFRWPRPCWNAADRTAIDDYFAALGPKWGPRVVLHPGTSAWGPHKRWPVEYFAALGDALVERRQAQVIVNWGPGEEALAAEILAAMRHPGVLAPATPDMRQVACFLSCVDLVVGSDTGPTHLAAMQRVPTVILFGPYDPRLYYPYQFAERAHFAALPCSPCRYRGCQARDCMWHLTPDDVLQTCLSGLDGTPAAPRRITPDKTVPT